MNGFLVALYRATKSFVVSLRDKLFRFINSLTQSGPGWSFLPRYFKRALVFSIPMCKTNDSNSSPISLMEKANPSSTILAIHFSALAPKLKQKGKCNEEKVSFVSKYSFQIKVALEILFLWNAFFKLNVWVLFWMYFLCTDDGILWLWWNWRIVWMCLTISWGWRLKG